MNQGGSDQLVWRLVRYYWMLVLACSVLTFGIWAAYTLFGIPSPLNANRNYEALFAVMYALFVHLPGLATVKAKYPELPKTPPGRIGAFIHVLLFLACYLIVRVPVYVLQRLVLGLVPQF